MLLLLSYLGHNEAGNPCPHNAIQRVILAYSGLKALHSTCLTEAFGFFWWVVRNSTNVAPSWLSWSVSPENHRELLNWSLSLWTIGGHRSRETKGHVPGPQWWATDLQWNQFTETVPFTRNFFLVWGLAVPISKPVCEGACRLSWTIVSLSGVVEAARGSWQLQPLPPGLSSPSLLCAVSCCLEAFRVWGVLFLQKSLAQRLGVSSSFFIAVLRQILFYKYL